MPDLVSKYLGLTLRNPLVAAAGPLSKKLDTLRKLEDAGVGAVVLHSLFEEQIVHESQELDHYLTRLTNASPEALTWFPDLGSYNLLPEEYLEHIRTVKAALDIPVIASLNGFTAGGWIEWAKRMEEAGADAIELNAYHVQTSVEVSSAQMEDDLVALIQEVRKQVKIPLSLKLSPFFAGLPHLCRRLSQAGVDGLVLFNRFLQPDLDPEGLDVSTTVKLSDSEDLRLPLRWSAILHGKVEADIAITTGIHNGKDLVKAVMSGAAVGQVTSEFLNKGPQRAAGILSEFADWMRDYEYISVTQMRGALSQKNASDPSAYERANYMKALQSFDHIQM
jgi:dihydroorotate dehydrogenase (fumarate)